MGVIRTAVVFIGSVLAVSVAVTFQRQAQTLAFVTTKLRTRAVSIHVRCGINIQQHLRLQLATNKYNQTLC